MPTTFTNNNGLSKPGNGELSGSWGTVANTLIDVVDRAISGVGAITLSGTTTTLTTSDGTLSEGNYRVLVLGGSPSGTNTITIAPNDAQKVYDVFNATSESAVFTQGSGSDVTIPAGGSAVIYADGGGSAGAVADLTSRFIRAGGTYDKLATLNGLAITDGNFIVANGTTWAAKTPAEVFAALGVSSSIAELDILDGATLDVNELNILDGATLSTAEMNILDGATLTTAEMNILDGVTATTDELNILDGVTATTAELNILDGVTATAAEINILDGVTATTTELNLMDGVTATTAELNILDGVTATTAELNYMDGVTSNVQTQIDGIGSGSAQTASASATLDFTWTGSPSRVEFILDQVKPATDGAYLTSVVSVDANSTFEVGASDYDWAALGVNPITTSTIGSPEASDSKIKHHHSPIGNASGEYGISGRIEILNPSAATRTQLVGYTTYKTSSGDWEVTNTFATYKAATTAVNGMRFLFSSGNITSGTITIKVHY